MTSWPVLLLALLSTAASAPAGTVVLDDTTPGVAFEGIVDGFPGLAPRDGDADFGGNPLSVVRKGEVTELRSVVEFPLAGLAGVAGADVTSATLHFNVDDVLSTLGPGTELDGTAAGSILVHLYAGDGLALLGDYRRTGETPTQVDTGTGSITDATLAQTGARWFAVDVRARLVEALVAGTSHLGVLWRTTDSPTGTSLDDGRGGSVSGEPAETSAGSRMPWLEIVVTDAPPPGCGNGVPDAGETCDDGNTADGDCCSRSCRLEGAGSGCSDGDACTAGDACDGAGACVPAGPTSCDDGSPCTTDSCAAAAGCVHAPANEGQGCDDGTVCTTGDVCTAGVCAGTATAGACDDGDACTSGDACRAGTCVGEPRCGNGVVDAVCAEACDDGNRADVDGCSATCRHDSLTGGTGATECLVSVAFARPVRADDGAVRPVQTCRDGDPACDGDPAVGTCGIDVAVCVGVADARVPACAPAASLQPAVVQPGRARRDRANRTRLDAALAGLVAPGCTAPVRVDVPVRTKGARRRPGKTKLVVRARPQQGRADRDVVVLGCLPAS